VTVGAFLHSPDICPQHAIATGIAEVPETAGIMPDHVDRIGGDEDEGTTQ